MPAELVARLKAAAEAKGVPLNDFISEAIQLRIAAKKARNFAEADAIRKQLLEAGIVLEDSAQGTTWRRA